MDSYQSFIAISRYSRWLDSAKRRETWVETVDRYMDFMVKDKVDPEIFEKIKNAILNLEVMPSMRGMMTAGKALKRCNTVNYNCCYIPINSSRSFDEVFYLLMGGCGVGFSVEEQFVSCLPSVPDTLEISRTTLVVEDSRIGWAKAFKSLIALLYAGEIPFWDVSHVRKSGSPLKTMGGRASGPAPLENIFNFTISLFEKSRGRKLSSYECHCLLCMCGEAVVVGGVRRCIAEGMRIWVHPKSSYAGYKQIPIEEVEVGDEVLTDNGVWKQVLNVFNQGTKLTYRVKYKIYNQCMKELICTPDHKIAYWTSCGLKWKQAIELKAGDCLYAPSLYPNKPGDSSNHIVVGVYIHKMLPTYDLEVKDDHRFTAESILVHNSALISLSNPSDDRMRNAKSGTWWLEKAYLSNANNSACYTSEKIEMDIFLPEWKSLYDSKSGERGIFNRAAAKQHILNCNQKRQLGQVERKSNFEFGTNPCSEIILRPFQMCNLTEVVCRPNDSMDKLLEKIEIASILGTIQSTLTNFKYIRSIWKKTCEEERLLGVSLTGIMDCPLLNNTLPNLKERLETLKTHAIRINHKYADKLNINASTAVTCIKPSGTVSQLVDASSGIHPRHAKYYIRRVRCDRKDPIYLFLKEQGVPVEQDVYKEEQVVFSFFIKAPEETITRNELNAIDHLELWKLYAKYYCEHKPSITVSVKEEEWLKVGSWVFDNFNIISGISFLPYTDTSYKQMPYEEIDEKTYYELKKKYENVNIDWNRLGEFEHDDRTKHSQTFSCTGDKCEIVDLI